MDKKAIEIVREYITNLLDDMYYELTFDADKDQWYLDAYRKFQ